MIAAQMESPHPASRRPRRRGTLIVLAAAAVSSLLLAPAGARAASYSVWACADGAGRLLTRGDWKEVRVNGPGHFLASTCGDRPDAHPTTRLLGIAESANGNAATDSGAGWRVQAADATKIIGLDLWWAGGTPSFSDTPAFTHIPGRVEVLAPTSVFRVEGPNGYNGVAFGQQATTTDTAGLAFDEGNHWRFANLNTREVTLMASCVSACQGLPGVGGEVFARTAAYFEAYRLKTLVEDAAPPRGLVVGLEDGARLGRPTTVQTTATDIGSGVREISLRVDGRVVERTSPGGACADVDPRNGDPFEYTMMHPCPGQYSAAFSLLPAEFADGARHLVSVVASDAGGAESVLMAAWAVLASPSGYFSSMGFFNPDLDPTPRRLNGENAGPATASLSFVLGHGKGRRLINRRVVGAGVQQRISGRLISTRGTPISGARVWIASAVAHGVWQISGGPLTTSRTGHVSGKMAAGSPSREVRLIYFPYSDRSENVQSPSRRLEVRASSTLHLDRSRYRNGGTVKFSGRITTTPTVRRKAVYLQVVVRGRWRTFDTVRANANGRWTLRYRFTATRRPTAYRFRAVIPAEHGFPWATGRSRAVRVVVTP